MIGLTDRIIAAATAPEQPFTIKTTKQTSFSLTIYCTTYNLVTIDWGDGTTTLVNNNTAKTKTWAAPGEQTVTITGDLTQITAVLAYNMQVTSITTHADLINVATFRVHTNTFSSLDLSMMTKLTYLEVYSNSYLTSLTMPAEVFNTATRNYRIYSTAITSYANPAGATTFSQFSANSCTSATSFDLSSMISCNQISISSCTNLQTIDLSNLATVSTTFNINSNPALLVMDLSSLTATPNLQMYSNSVISSINASSLISGSINFTNCPLLATLSLGALTTTTNISLYRCNLIAPPILSTITSVTAIDMRKCGLSQTEVDNILAQCVTISNTDSSCTLNLSNTLSGGADNSAPSAAGLADKATLVARGWIVTTA